MTDTLSTLTAHFERLKGQSYEVPGVTQSDGTPLVIYYDPPTNAQGNAIRQRAGANGSNEAAMTLHTVIALSKDKDGNRLFNDDAATMKALSESVPGSILTKIATAILYTSKVPDLEK